MNYEQANELLQGRYKSSRKIANNTYLRRDDNRIVIRLHDTDIVTYFSSGIVKVNSGGFFTRTTFDRLNEYVDGCRFYSSKRIPYVRYDGKDYSFDVESFEINSDGQIGLSEFDIDVERETKKLLRTARKYARDYVKALKSGKVPPPSNGDCWGCLMTTEDGKRPMGGKDHMLSHMSADERYYVPSIALRAIETFGGSPVSKMALGACWYEPKTTAEGIMETMHGNNSFLDIGFEQLEKAIYRFVVRELGLSA